MEFTVQWMMLSTNLDNLDPQDLQEKMGLSDLLDKKENKVLGENQVKLVPMVQEETWVQWVFLVLWVSLDPQVIMDPRDFQVKWDP